jgi:uncharacterized repeat protein (TIGR01451 family)
MSFSYKSIKASIKSILNIVLLFIVLIANVIIFTKDAKADSFYLKGGDINYCNLAMTTSVSYRDLPANNIQNKITYDGQQVRGVSGNYPSTHRFAPELGTLAYPKPERYKGIADSIKVPPLTTVDLGYYTHNYSGHSINILDAWAFVSKPSSSEGDWTRLGSPGTNGSLSWNRNGVIETRTGKMVNLGAQGIRQNDPSGDYSNQTGRSVLSFKTIQPLVINYRNVTPEYYGNRSLKLRYDASVTNVSSYTLSNVLLENILPNNTTFQKVENFNPGETKNITYYADIGNTYYNSIYIHPLKVVDPNEHIETLAGSEDKVVIARRDDQGAPAGWSATQPDFHLPLSITLLPYSIYSSDATIQTFSELTVLKQVSDTDEKDVKVNTARPGENLNYKITVKNIGARSLNTILRDNYDQTKLKILDSFGGNDNGDEIVWNLGILENNETRTLNISAQLNLSFAQGSYQAPNNVTLKNQANIEVSDNTQTNIVANADLKITKLVSDNDETLVKQNTIQGASIDIIKRRVIYNIEVSNVGTAQANVVNLVDDYDESQVSISELNGGVVNDGKISWKLGTLMPGQTVKVEISGTINQNILQERLITNTATVTSNQTNPVTDSVSTKAVVPIIEIDKRVSDIDEHEVKENHIQGGHYLDEHRILTYKITAKNSGNGESNAVVITDNVSQLIENGSLKYISDGGSLDASKNLIWNIGKLNPGESREVSFSILLKPNLIDMTRIPNIAILDSDETDIIKSNTNTIVHSPQLFISKQVDKSAPKADEELNYKIKVTNTGSGNAYDLRVIDHLPGYLTPKYISDNGIYDKTQRTIIWEDLDHNLILNGSFKPEDIGINYSKEFNYIVVLDSVLPIGTNKLENKAVVSSNNGEEIETIRVIDVEALPINTIKKYLLNETAQSNGREHSGRVGYGEDANIQSGDTSDVWAISGDIIRYTLVYKNNGQANSPNTYIKDILPKYINDNAGGKHEIIRKEDILDLPDDVKVLETENGYEILWELGEIKVSNIDRVITFRVRINQTGSVALSKSAQQRLIDNNVEIGSLDQRVIKNFDNAILQINQPNIVLKKGSDHVEYQSLDEVIYSIEVENTGSAVAKGIVRDTLPNELFYKSSNWQVDKTRIDNKDLTFDIDLKPQEKIKITVVTGIEKSVKDLVMVSNEASFEYKDENQNSYSVVKDRAEIKVLAPNLKVFKKVEKSNGDLKVGSKLKYTIEYENSGSGTVKEFSIIDEIPQNTVYVENSAKPSENSIVRGGDTGKSQIEWKLGNLAPGSKGQVSFEVVVSNLDNDLEIKNIAFARGINYEEIRTNEVILSIADKKGEIKAARDSKISKSDTLVTSGQPVNIYSVVFGSCLVCISICSSKFSKKIIKI